MADLGAIGRELSLAVQRGPVVRVAPLGGFNFLGPWTGSLQHGPSPGLNFRVRPTPVPSVGRNSLLFISPGEYVLQRPVDPSTVLTVTVKARKSKGYGTLAALPFLECVSPDGQRAKAVMPDTDETWNTLSVSLTLTMRGAALIRLVRPSPSLGSNSPPLFWNINNDELLNVSGGLVWFSDLIPMVAIA